MAIAGALFTFGSGCAFFPTSEARDKWSRTYPLTAGGSFELHNTNGRIQVDATDGSNIEVIAEKIARAGSDEGAREAVRRIEISETVAPDRVLIDSTKSSWGFQINVSKRVDYVVKVPRTAQVRIESTNGDIEVTGLGGAFRAEATNGMIRGTGLENRAEVKTTNGRVSLAFAKLHEGGVSCSTTNGAVEVLLPTDVKANVTADVTNGEIETGGLELTVIKHTRRHLEATVGGGGPQVRVETTNGSVSVRSR
jgi:hypothetical protein